MPDLYRLTKSGGLYKLAKNGMRYDFLAKMPEHIKTVKDAIFHYNKTN